MSKDLNKLERAIINEIIEFNKQNYPFISKHIPYLSVKFRKTTGVGMYVYFEYSKKGINFEINNFENICLSSDKSLKLDNLKYDINYEINISKGKLDFLELVTNGESWDGSYKTFNFT